MLRALRFTGIVCFILGFAGVEKSEAQTYDFAFTGIGLTGTAILATNGSLGIISAGTSITYGGLTGSLYTAGGIGGNPSFGTNPILSSVTASPYFSTFVTGDAVFKMSDNTYDVIYNATGTNDAFLLCPDVTCSTGSTGAPITVENMTIQGGAAPLPGAGIYSWMTLIAGGLWISRKKIQALAKPTADGFARVLASARS